MNLQNEFKPYLEVVEREMRNLKTYQNVPLFYDPIYYVLDQPGKKIRPLMVMLSCEMAGGTMHQAAPVAAAVELLHDFTLVHDDIMDNDETRRGRKTVHVKWDLNTAILSGDGLLGFAFQKLLQVEHGDKVKMAQQFTEAMIVICEGQGLDKMFEQQKEVTAAAYLDMIERKTAALLRLSCQLGGLVAEASNEMVEHLYQFGHNLGMGFQVQDDILDVMADQKALGKKVGSDFEMQKQTLLSIKLREKIGAKAFDALSFEDYTQHLKNKNVLDETQDLADQYFEKARHALEAFPDGKARDLMLGFAEYIQKRTF